MDLRQHSYNTGTELITPRFPPYANWTTVNLTPRLPPYANWTTVNLNPRLCPYANWTTVNLTPICKLDHSHTTPFHSQKSAPQPNLVPLCCQ